MNRPDRNYKIALERIEKTKEEESNILDLSNLGLTKIPKEIRGLTALTTLYLHDNKLSKIEYLEQLTSLEQLSLNRNTIAKLKGLEKLTKLQKLNLSNNFLIDLEFLDKLVSLEYLNLSHNKINTLKGIDKLGKLTKLEKLFLNANDIAEKNIAGSSIFFDYLNSKKNFLFITINDNPFLDEIEGLQKEDYIKGENHLPILLSDEKIIRQDEKENLVLKSLPYKLVLLGNSDAGKSSLADFLCDDRLQDGTGKKSTEILDIRTWKVNEELDCFIYDFGGQDYYHATYQMFFTEGTTYLLLWSKDSNYKHLNDSPTKKRPKDYFCYDANYWLGNIHYLNGIFEGKKRSQKYVNKTKEQEGEQENDLSIQESNYLQNKWLENVIIVENKIDATFKKPNPLHTDSSFGEMELFKISLLAKKNTELFKQRRELLKTYLKGLPIKSKKVNKRQHDAIGDFLKIKKELIEEKNEWSYQELKKKLETNYPSWRNLKQDTEETKIILKRFRNSGLLIWFSESKNDKLKDKLWLDPMQLQKNVLPILNNPKLEEKKGRIEIGEWDKIDKNFKKYKDLLIEQQIVFKDEAHYIIPQYLPLDQDEKPLYRIAMLGLQPTFTVRFKHFMPLGIMNRLICAFGRGEGTTDKFYGRYEMIFNYGTETVLLKCDMEELEIQVSMKGEDNNIDTWKEVFRRILLAYNRKTTPDADDANENFSEDGEGKPLVPPDLQLALSDGYYVNYSELLKAQNDKELYVTMVKNNDGDKSNDDSKRTHIYNFRAFLEGRIDKPKKVFISYAHDDSQYLSELEKYLVTLKDDGLIETWQDGKIAPGIEWDKEIREKLEAADIVIFLVTQSLIASKYVNKVELRRTLERLEKEEVKIFPVLVKGCGYKNWKVRLEDTRLTEEANEKKMKNFQFTPRDDEGELKPINQWQYPEDAWVQLSEELRDILEERE